MPFDIFGAREAGYSDDEIKEHLRPFFDVDGALNAGYSLEEISETVQFKKTPTPEPEPPPEQDPLPAPAIDDDAEIQDIAMQVGVPSETIRNIREIEKGRRMFAEKKARELRRGDVLVPKAEAFPGYVETEVTRGKISRGVSGRWGRSIAEETAHKLYQEAAAAPELEPTRAESFALGFATFPFAKTLAAKVGAVMSDKPYEEALGEQQESIKEIFEAAEKKHPGFFKGGEITSDVAEFILINRLITAYGVGSGAVTGMSRMGKLSPLGRYMKLFDEGFVFGGINKLSEQIDDGEVKPLGVLGSSVKDGLAFMAFGFLGEKAVAPLAKKAFRPLATKLRSWADGRRIKFGQSEAEKVADAIDLSTEFLQREAAAEGKLISELTPEQALKVLEKNKDRILKALTEGDGVTLLTPEEKYIVREIIAKEPAMKNMLNKGLPVKHPNILIENITDDGVRLIEEEGSRRAGSKALTEIPYGGGGQGGRANFSFQEKLSAARNELNRLQKAAGLKKDYAVNIRLNAFSDEAQYSMINEAIRFHEQLARIKEPRIIFAKIREQARRGTGLKYLNMLLDLDKEKAITTLDELRLTMAANSRRRTELIARGMQNTDEFVQLTQSQNYLMQTSVKLGDFAGTFLRAFKENVGRPALQGKSYRRWSEEILKSANRLNRDVNLIKEEMSRVDLDDPIAASNFYDKYVAPKLGDLIDEFRYINMLSSPRTHLINTMTNMGQIFITAPSTKAMTAAIEVPWSFVTRRQRQYFFGEATSYMGGVLTSGNKALKAAADAWMGRSVMRHDLAGIGIRRITRSFGDLRKNFGFRRAVIGKIQNSWVWDKARAPIKALEASDAFFRTLAEEGELSSLGYAQRYAPKAGGITERVLKQRSDLFTRMTNLQNIAKTAAPARREAIEGEISDIKLQLADLQNSKAFQDAKESSLYYIFRQGLKPEGQGYVLNFVDDVTQLIMASRQLPVVGRPLGWVVPFIQTPVNIFKQGIEYSPAGILTVPGAARKEQQIAKAALGSLVTTSAMMLGSQNRLIWEAPKDPKERNAFYAANLLPHSVIVGDRMVQFKYLGIYAYPLMLAASVQHHYNEGIAKIADPATKEAKSSHRVRALTTMMPHIVASMVGFLGELPYAQNFGLLIDFAQREEGAMNRFAANFVRQVMPGVGFTSWFNRMNDEYVRKPEKIQDFLRMGVPWPAGLREIPTFERKTPEGEILPAERDARVFNAFTIATRQKIDKEAYEYYLQLRDERWFKMSQKEIGEEKERQKNVERARVYSILKRTER